LQRWDYLGNQNHKLSKYVIDVFIDLKREKKRATS